MGLHEWRGGEGPVWGSRILRKEQGAGARGGEDGSLHPHPPPPAASREDVQMELRLGLGGRQEVPS